MRLDIAHDTKIQSINECENKSVSDTVAHLQFILLLIDICLPNIIQTAYVVMEIVRALLMLRLVQDLADLPYGL